MLFADDPAPRWLTAACVVDVNTLAGADKFGNVFVCRLPQEVSDDVDDAQLLTSGEGIVNGAPSKADPIVQFHVGDTITSLQKVVLGPGCAEVIVYTTLQGGIGALLPFSSKEDLELLQALEMHLRQEAPPLCGRDQLFFRSSYFPIKGVVDGDFCAFFNRPGVDGGVAPREYEFSCLGAACPGRCPDGVPNRGASAGEGASRSDMLKEEIVARLRSSPA